MSYLEMVNFEMEKKPIIFIFHQVAADCMSRLTRLCPFFLSMLLKIDQL